MRMKIVIATICMLASATVSATAQFPDLIKLDGKEQALNVTPFSVLMDKAEIRDKLVPFLGPRCSAAWRGYTADWEIRDKKLLLTALRANPCAQNPTNIPLTVFFPGVNGPVQATWFTGRLVIPRGKVVEYIHMGFATKYEKYLLIHVRDGVVESEKEVESLPPEK